MKLLGKPSNYVRSLLQNLNLKDVELIEPVTHDQMSALYQRADVVVTDMAYGAMPTTSIEALACGKPVVQYIKQGVYGEEIEFPPVFSVKETTPIALFDVLEQFADHAPRSGKYRRYVEKHHDAKKVAETVSMIYDEVVSYDGERNLEIATMILEEVEPIES